MHVKHGAPAEQYQTSEQNDQSRAFYHKLVTVKRFPRSRRLSAVTLPDSGKPPYVIGEVAVRRSCYKQSTLRHNLQGLFHQ